MQVQIIGAGIGGLTLALQLHKRGIACRVFEAAPAILPIGVGLNLLPHAVKELTELGLQADLLAAGIATERHWFFTRHGQKIFADPRGLKAGYAWPQISIHRADLQAVLLSAVRARLGEDSVVLGHRCVDAHQTESGVVASFCDSEGNPLPSQSSEALIACDGIHSVIRKKIAVGETAPRYSGINMWRGVVRARPYLEGATMVHIGWYATGNIVIYPIRAYNDGSGDQLINWVASIETPQHELRRWDLKGKREDFIKYYEGFVFDWIDVPQLIAATNEILEYPMVDQDPLERWTDGRITLLGDAAHPMYPRGSNGAGQAIVDTRCLAECLSEHSDVQVALQKYEAVRRPATTDVVLMNRSNPPDAILREVYERTGDKPFEDLDSVISPAERQAVGDRYKSTAGFDLATLAAQR